jgi:hypothetical protein
VTERLTATPADLDAARQIAKQHEAGHQEGSARLSLRDADGRIRATVRSDSAGVVLWVCGDSVREPSATLTPGAARRLAAALLEHADHAERR